jgi:hypothetical protein
MGFMMRLSRGETTRPFRKGEWSCPNCKSLKPAVHYQHMQEWRLWGLIGLGGDQLIKEYTACEGCGAYEPVENFAYNPATKTFDPVQWDCPWCKHLNPNTTFRCKQCDRSLV